MAVLACFLASLGGFVGLVVTGVGQRLVVDESSCEVTQGFCCCDGSISGGTENVCESNSGILSLVLFFF